MRHFPVRQRGASMVEFVIVMPLAILFVTALIQLGFIYMARSTLNQATFMAARAGALNNADPGVIKENLIRGLGPFYQNSTTTSDFVRLYDGYTEARKEIFFAPWILSVTVLNPSANSFRDFGVTDPASHATYIPNDNLEWRRTDIVGSASHQNIRDANLLKIKVVYGYKLKVDLIAGVIQRVMCGGTAGVSAWGNVGLLSAISPTSINCIQYYANGRVPIESYATVEMQTRAIKP